MYPVQMIPCAAFSWSYREKSLACFAQTTPCGPSFRRRAWTAPQQASGFGQCRARPELRRAQKTRWHALLAKQDAVKSLRWSGEHHHGPTLYWSGPTVLYRGSGAHRRELDACRRGTDAHRRELGARRCGSGACRRGSDDHPHELDACRRGTDDPRPGSKAQQRVKAHWPPERASLPDRRQR